MNRTDSPVHEILGVPIHAMRMSEVVTACERSVERRERLLLGVVNAAKIVHMRKDPALREAVLSADMILADGMSVVWASRLLRRRLPERVAGIDLMMRLLERGNQLGWRVFCLGATDEVLVGVKGVIARDYPNVTLAGMQNGYYKPDEEPRIAEEIAASRADLLFVAMTSPKKEVFLGRYAERLDVPVCHGVGGAFDVVAGKVKRAPRLWQALGMEWLYRVLQEPGRLWKRYLETNSAFCWMVGREIFRGPRRRNKGLIVPAEGKTAATSKKFEAACPTEIIEAAEQLEALRDEWNELLADSAADSIFLRSEWAQAWIASRRRAPRILTVVARDASGRMIAAAPLYLTLLRLGGTLGYRCLRVLGDRDSGFEYPDLILRRGHETEGLAAITRALHARRRSWDCLWMPQAAQWTGGADRIAALAADARWRLNRRTANFAAVSLPATHAAYLESLSSNQRSNIRRSWKRVEATGRVSFERCDSDATLKSLMGALIDLHQRRWEASGEPGSFRAASFFRKFCETFAPLALRRGWLRLHALRIADSIAAVQFGYVYRGTFLQIQEGYDPSGPEGLGNVLRDHVMRRCIEEGLKEYDFLGEFTEHKRRWGAEARAGVDVFCGRRTVKNRLLFTRPVWPTGRYLREFEQPEATPVSTVDAGTVVDGRFSPAGARP